MILLNEKHMEYKLFVDGAVSGNGKKNSIGGIGMALCWSEQEKEHCETMKCRIKNGSTNNEAEYLSLINGIIMANDYMKDKDKLRIHMDSQLAVKQINGEYQVKNETLKILHSEAKNLLSSISNWSITHIDREENKLADSLAREAKKLTLAQ